MRCGGRRRAIFRARNLAQLLRHGKSFGRKSRRLIRQKYLCFGFSFGLYRRLKRQASLMLLGNVLDRSMPRLFRLGGRAPFQGENHLANFDFLAFFDPNLLDRAAYRRGNLHHGLVGFQFHHRLAFGDSRARGNHQPDKVALIDVFSQLRQSEFSRASCRWQGRGGRSGRGSNFPQAWCFGFRSRGRRFLCRYFRLSLWLGEFNFGPSAIFDREDHLTNLHLLSFFDPDIHHRSGHRRRHLDHSLVGFQFHHGLAFGHAGARRNHQADKVALVNVLTEFRQLEFCH